MKGFQLATLGAVLSLAAARPSHADALDDVRRGTNVRLSGARIEVNSNTYGAGSWLLPKAAGTLDMNIPASSFGLASTLVLHMHGSRAGDTLVWTFDDTLVSPYDLGSSQRVSRVSGTLVVRASLVRGADDPSCDHASCPYDVQLTLAPGSLVTVDGYMDLGVHWGWSRVVTVQQLTLFAGVPRPRLASMSVTVPAARCASDVWSELAGTVTLSSPAPVGGISVDVQSADASVGALPVRVPEAATSASFTLLLPPNWNGATLVTAGSGGAVRSQRVALSACPVPQPFNSCMKFYYPLPPLVFLPHGAAIVRVEGSDLLLRERAEPLDLRKLLEAERVQVVGADGSGEISGTAWTSKGPQAFRIDTAAERPSVLQTLDGWETLAGNWHGNLLVAPAANTGGGASRLDALGPLPFPGLEGLASTRTIFNGMGEVALTVQTPEGPRATYVSGGEQKTLVDTESEVVGLSDTGEVVGQARESGKGGWSLFRWSARHGLTWLPALPNTTSAVAVGINVGGWVVGNATGVERKTPHPFIISPEGRVMALEGLVPDRLRADGCELYEVLGIDDDNQVFVQLVNPEGGFTYGALQP